MLLTIVVVLAVLFSVLPAMLFVDNLQRYSPPTTQAGEPERVSVLIPARDEQDNISPCIEHVLASRNAGLEVLVLDDGSTDRTVAIVQQIAAHDARLSLLHAPALPSGWNGKQHACWTLANAASESLLLFLDADVRLSPDAIACCVAARKNSKAALLSGFPRQITVGWMEWMLLPLVHFVLLGFLPLARMRRSTSPAYAAGCGQFMLVQRGPYFESGGHRAVRETRHDGLRLPQAFRRHGFATDLVDLTELAEVRMYDSPRAVWQGLAKNATEGLAAPLRIVPFTLQLTLGQIAPLLLCIWVWLHSEGALLRGAVIVALIASYLPRLLAVPRFRQPRRSALLHPVGVAILLALQWYALALQLMGRPIGWRARKYSSETGEEIVETRFPQ